jgi:hypothetical protein
MEEGEAMQHDLRDPKEAYWLQVQADQGLMVWCWLPSWEPQEKGMISTAASFPQYETKVYQTSRRKNQLSKVDANWLGDSSRQFIYGALWA